MRGLGPELAPRRSIGEVSADRAGPDGHRGCMAIHCALELARSDSAAHPVAGSRTLPRVTDARELQVLAEGLECALGDEGAEQLLVYLDAMLAENQRINLTAVREREAAVMFHALDSLAVGSEALRIETTSCLDIGTGNGFPGVAVACIWPEAEVVLIDRTLKKLKAIERALAAAEIDPARVRCEQRDALEAPAHGHAKWYDLVTARAVGEPRAVGALARPLLRPNGNFVCWMSEEQRAKSPLPKAFKAPRYFEYDLPAPADRHRILARYGR